MADRDQAAAEADQRVSDCDQAAADRELASNPSSDQAFLLAHEQAQADRSNGTITRMATRTTRAHIASERHEQAVHRDEVAHRRDEAATARDRQDEEADRAEEELAARLGKDSPAAKVAAVARAAAAAARSHAAKDRDRAASDREAAARDREMLTDEIERSYRDEPTGAYGQRIGEVLLRHEIERAQGTKGSLALGVIAIEPATQGETAPGGDPARANLLGDAFRALQIRLHPYDPIVRWGASEFVCAIFGATEAQARNLLNGTRSDIARDHSLAGVSGGCAAFVDGDNLSGLIARAKVDQLRSKPNG